MDLILSDVIHDGNKIYGVSNKYEGIFALDKTSASISSLYWINKKGENGYTGIFQNINYLLAVSITGDSLIVYDKINKIHKSFSIPYRELLKTPSIFSFFSGCISDENVYLFGYSYPGIVKINIITGCSEVFDDWYYSHMKEFQLGYDGFFHLSHYMSNNFIYCPFMNLNAILKYNILTDEIEIIYVGDSSQRYISMVVDKNDFWLIPRDGRTGSVIKWNLETRETYYFDKYPKEFNYCQYAFFRTEIYDNFIYLFAHQSNINICIDILTGEMHNFQHLYNVDGIYTCKYRNIILDKNVIYCLLDDKMITWNLETKETEVKPFIIDEMLLKNLELRKMKAYMKQSKGILYEQSQISLKEYTRYIIL